MFRSILLVVAILGLFGLAPVAAQPAIPYTTGGTACAGSNGPVMMTNDPMYPARVGQTFVLHFINMPTAPGVFYIIFGFSNTVWSGLPLPFDLSGLGMFLCYAYVAVDIVIPWSFVNGSGWFQIQLPNDPSLAGLMFYNQALIMDPMAPNPARMTTSNWGMGQIQC